MVVQFLTSIADVHRLGPGYYWARRSKGVSRRAAFPWAVFRRVPSGSFYAPSGMEYGANHMIGCEVVGPLTPPEDPTP